MTPEMTRRMQAVRTVLNSEYYESRREAMKTLYTGGATLEEIGAVYGVTRERVRQVIAGNAKRGKGLDPIRTITVCRRAGSFSAAVIELGSKPSAVRTFLEQTGYWAAMSRLWKWRTRRLMREFTDTQMIDALRALAQRLGHTPSMNEVNADPNTPSHTTYVHRWGNWAPACLAAGLTPSVVGAHGHKNRDPLTGRKFICKRGHPLTEGHFYVNKRGGRVCKECCKLRDREERQQLIDAGKLKPRASRVHRPSSLLFPEVIAARMSA